jgi:acetyl-CoA synthetase
MTKVTALLESPNVVTDSYAKTCTSLSWKDMEEEFSWHETGNLNIAYEAVDRWASNQHARDRKALIFEKAGNVSEFTYFQLQEQSSRWANLLIKYGFAVGDRLFIFLPPCPEIYLVMLACARLGVIFSPLYPTLKFDELEVRLLNAKPRGIVTHADLAERLPDQAMKNVPHVFIVDGPAPGLFSGEAQVREILEELPQESPVRWVRGGTPLYLIYTSGSTGPPKGVVHAHQDMLGHLMTSRCVLNISEGSILWTDGDPGWVTGTVYGAFAPWLSGATSVIQGDRFSASTWLRTLERHRVSVWYTTPRTLTRLMEAGDDLPARYDFSHLKHIATAGETLGHGQSSWAERFLGHVPHATWWMTETGMICLANSSFVGNKPGSMGKPIPGIEAAVLDEEGQPLPAMTLGELALRPGWPAMMKGIWQDPARYHAYFRLRGWFLTGDMVTVDEDGYFYHHGRNDDLIKVGAKFVGPYEIEQVLSLHPAVGEAVVISLGSISGTASVKGFVTIGPGFTASARLNREIKSFVKANFNPDLPLKEIEFLDELPKSRSGKLLRRVLSASERKLAGSNTLRQED